MSLATTSVAGGPIFASAARSGRSPSVPATDRCSGVLAHWTIAAGWDRGSPAATSSPHVSASFPAAIKLPERWRDTVGRQGHGFTDVTPVSHDEAAREHLLMNLRLAEGIDLAAYEQRWDTRPAAKKIAALTEHGFLTQDGDILRATPTGRLLLNRVIEEILN